MAELAYDHLPLTETNLAHAKRICDVIGTEITDGGFDHALIPLRELADKVGIAHSTVSIIVNELVAKKVILRHPGHLACYHGAGEPW